MHLEAHEAAAAPEPRARARRPSAPLALAAMSVVLFGPCPDAAAQPFTLPATQSPATSELLGAADLPFLARDCRIQQAYAASEVGASAFTLSRIALRFDGPAGGPSQRAHAIRELTLEVGATAVGVDRMGSDFAANRSAPLGRALDRVRIDYLTDDRAHPGPEPFGGPSGRLVLALAAPVPVVVPTGGAFLLDVRCVGNDNTSDPARLDAFLDPANTVGNGFVTGDGRGCPAGQNLPQTRLEVAGLFEPGGSISVHGDGYLPNAPVATFFTAALLQQPFAITGTTPTCWVYLDLATGFGPGIRLASGSGTLAAFDRGGTLPIPKTPRLPGAVLYVQNASLALQWSGNAAGVSSSNYRTVRVGTLKAPAAAAWLAVHHADADASVASAALWGGLALRIE